MKIYLKYQDPYCKEEQILVTPEDAKMRQKRSKLRHTPLADHELLEEFMDEHHAEYALVVDL